jgi:hypothetical protein
MSRDRDHVLFGSTLGALKRLSGDHKGGEMVTHVGLQIPYMVIKNDIRPYTVYTVYMYV